MRRECRSQVLLVLGKDDGTIGTTYQVVFGIRRKVHDHSIFTVHHPGVVVEEG